MPESTESSIKALELALTEGLDRETPVILSNLALNDLDANRIARSLATSQLARAIAEALEDPELLARSHLHLMRTYGETAFFELAESEYELFRQLPMPEQLGTIDQATLRRRSVG